MAQVDGAIVAPPGAKPVTREARCTVCRHPDRQAIDAEIIKGNGGRPLAARFGLTKQAVARHAANHVPSADMRTAHLERVSAEGDRGATLVESAAELRDKAHALLQKAETAGDLKTALVGVREAARCLELVAKLTGQIDESVKLNIAFAPAMLELQTIVITALAAFPEARLAVAQALGSLSGSSPARLLVHQP